MESITRQRVDKFVSDGGRVSVTGRRNHTFSAGQFVSRPHKLTFKQPTEEKDGEYYYEGAADGSVLPWPTTGLVHGHMKELYAADNLGNPQPIQFTVKPWAINNSISSLKIDCAAVTNTQECRPRDQVAMLPYLCDKIVSDNIYSASPSITPTLYNTQRERATQVHSDVNPVPEL